MKRRLMKILSVVFIVGFVLMGFTGCSGGYAVTFESNDGSEVAAQKVKSSRKIETEPSTTRPGYLFQGWFESETDSKKVSFPYEVKENTTLYAKWEQEGAYQGSVSLKLYIGAFPGGPAAEKAILTFDKPVSKNLVNTDTFVVSHESGGSSQVSKLEANKVYLADANGAEVSDLQSMFIVVEFNTRSSAMFTYDSKTSFSLWVDKSTFTVSLNDNSKIEVDGKEYTALAASRVSIEDYVIPPLDEWKLDGSYTLGEQTLTYAAYEPKALEGEEKNPLVIWLHGAGEGGTDSSITVLGNEVTGISGNKIQSYFRSETQTGAYVFAPQCPTRWMDDGTGVFQYGDKSGYTDILWATIKEYVNGNIDIDPSRIYIGGCSNGGYMTMNLMITDTENYFAAAFPICQVYGNENITDTIKNSLAGRAIWFTQSQDDTTVPPSTTNELYVDLINKGADNIFYSSFETVTYDGVSYPGHFSWIYTLRDECKFIQPTSGKNGNLTVEELDPKSTSIHSTYSTLWAWLAMQSK